MVSPSNDYGIPATIQNRHPLWPIRCIGKILFNVLARGGGSFDPSWRKVEVKILFNVWARGGGSFDPSWRKVEVKILFNVLARGDGGFVPHEDKQQKLRSYLSYWPKGG